MNTPSPFRKPLPGEPYYDPDMDVDIHQLIREVVPDPDVWTVSPNILFSLRRPIDLIGSPDEDKLRTILRAAKNVVYS